MTRINYQSTPELDKLFQELSNLDEKTQRRVVLEICRLVSEKTGANDLHLQNGLALLKKESYGDSPQRKAIENLTQELDETAWNIQGQIEAGIADKDEYYNAFHKARAANALWFALDQDLSKAVSETIYEANAAIDNIEILRSIIEKAK